MLLKLFKNNNNLKKKVEEYAILYQGPTSFPHFPNRYSAVLNGLLFALQTGNGFLPLFPAN